MTPRAAVTRRTAIAAALAPAALAGCDIDPPPDPAPPGAATPPPLEDSVLVGSLVTAIARAEAVVRAAGDAVPGLRPALDGLLAAHAAHRALLVEAAPDAPAPATPDGGTPATRQAALAAVRRSEQRLLVQIERGCARASSGDLARALAAMAGSLAQHAATLDAVQRSAPKAGGDR